MKNRQRGITVIETLGALAVASLLLLGLSRMMDDSVEDLKGQQAALYQSQLVNATRKFIEANHDEISWALTWSDVLPITVADLQPNGWPGNSPVGWLPASFASTNAYGQLPCVLIRLSNPAIPDRFDALVVTHDGRPIPEKDIPVVAMNAGHGGGFISATQPNVAQGAGWNLDTTPYRSGHCGNGTVLTGNAVDGGHLASMVYFDGPGQKGSDFLYRNEVPGHPELTTMNAPIGMAGMALVTRDTACGTSAAIAIDVATRNLLTCGPENTWKAVTPWKEAVADFGDLPASGDLRGDVRMVTSINRAFTYDGAGWVALAADENGNLTIPGNFRSNDIHVNHVISTGNVYTHDVSATNVYANDITADNQVMARTVHGTKSVRGGYLRADRFTETGELILTRRMSAGNECHIPGEEDGLPIHIMPIGTVLLDAGGIPLVCANDKVFRYANGTFLPN